MYWWSATWSRPSERARGSFVSSVTIQAFSLFWLSGLGRLWSLLWLSWKSGMGVCRMLTTLQELWVVFNSKCIRSQDVTLCPTLLKRGSSQHSANSKRWLSGIILCRSRGDSHERRYNENWTFFCCTLWSWKVPSMNTAWYMIYTKKKG